MFQFIYSTFLFSLFFTAVRISLVYILFLIAKSPQLLTCTQIRIFGVLEYLCANIESSGCYKLHSRESGILGSPMRKNRD